MGGGVRTMKPDETQNATCEMVGGVSGQLPCSAIAYVQQKLENRKQKTCQFVIVNVPWRFIIAPQR